MIDSTQPLSYERLHPRPASGCAHIRYRLSCRDFDTLMADAGHRCQICGFTGGARKREWLVIDHDHERGIWAVRGILCSGCNTHLAQHQIGMAKNFDAAAGARYLSNPWIDRHLGADSVSIPSEPPARTIAKVAAGPHWRRWGRFEEGWQLLNGRNIHQLQICTWSIMVSRYGPHRIAITNEILPPRQKARRFHKRLFFAYI